MPALRNPLSSRPCAHQCPASPANRTQEKRLITVTFPDGRLIALDPAYVRRNDQSAKSVDEWTGIRMSRDSDVPEGIEPVELHLLGNYAVQISWQDGFNQVRGAGRESGRNAPIRRGLVHGFVRPDLIAARRHSRVVDTGGAAGPARGSLCQGGAGRKGGHAEEFVEGYPPPGMLWCSCAMT